MPVVLLTLVLTVVAPEFEAQTLDGRILVGTVVELTDRQVTIKTGDGNVSVGVDKLLELRPKNQPPEPEEEPGAWVELVDGSSLVGRQYTAAKGIAHITLLDGTEVELPTAGVTSVRFRDQSPPIAAEWSRILAIKRDSDLLVVSKAETIDYHRGVLRDVTDEVVQFDPGGELLPVKRSKVHGLVYSHPPGAGLPEAICRIGDSSGSRWSVRGLALSGKVEWTTPAGVKVSSPLVMLTQIDFSRGKVAYLSDMNPESVEFTPYFGTTEDLPVLEKFFAPRRDKNLESGTLQLVGRKFPKGLAVHSRTEIVYRLPGRFSRFKAVAGIDDAVRPHGHVRLVIHGDEKVLLETTLTGNDPPKPIDLDVTGVRRITVLVDFGEQLDVADHLDLCEARIVK